MLLELEGNAHKKRKINAMIRISSIDDDGNQRSMGQLLAVSVMSVYVTRSVIAIIILHRVILFDSKQVFQMKEKVKDIQHK